MTIDLVNAQQLLTNINALSASFALAQKRYAPLLAPNFRLFDHFYNDEMALSRYIAFLLNSRENHAQGNTFLQQFIQELGDCASWAKSNLLKAVYTEHSTHNNRRIDIVLEFENGIIGIENKPWAEDQKKQLEDYSQFLQSKNANWILIYASNNNPDPISIKEDQLKELEANGHYFQWSFHEVVKWLEQCSRLSQAESVRLFTRELAAYVRYHINGELEMTEKTEIQNLILKEHNNIKSAFSIYSSIHDVKNQLLKTFKDDLETVLKANNMALVWEDSALTSGKCYAGFGVLFQPHHEVHLRFEFAQTHLNYLEWGICLKDKKSSIADEKLQFIQNSMNNSFGTGENSKCWPWFLRQIDESLLTTNERYWANNPDAWLLMITPPKNGDSTAKSELVSRIVSLAIKVKEALSDGMTNRL